MRVISASQFLRLDWGEGLSVLYSCADRRTHLVHSFAADFLQQIAERTGGLAMSEIDLPSEALEALIWAGLLLQQQQQ